ncbi:MAG: gamma-glutamyltransferase, partial [Candidatus Marinimicrobia bacterium]|nr:gamma-glutamyltransferase [Candidatus Neomarinimicrobiota bacterium]
MKKIFTILFISIISINLYAEDRYNRSTKNGVVVSTSFYASEVGAKILRDGGNATDATVATAFALAVTWPAAGNIGGGGFLIYHGINGENTSFDFREKAPLAAHKTMYLDKNGELIKNSNHLGLRSVGVPGSVAGLWDFHQKYGNLSWEKCLKPAIELAENGFPLTAALHRHIHKGKVSRLIKEYPSTRNIFLNESGKIISEGEIWIQKDLAQTLKRIQSKGKSGFYKGETAKILSKLMAKNGGIITKKDLNKYRAVERPVLTGNYKNYQILGMPAPSSGGTAIIEMLNMLETFELDEEKASARNTHIYTEVMRRAFADRAKYLGDPDF